MTTKAEVYDAYLEALVEWAGDIDAVECTIKWNEDGVEEDVVIKLNDIIAKNDEDIFFYCPTLYSFLDLMNPFPNGEDFRVIKVRRFFSNERENNN